MEKDKKLSYIFNLLLLCFLLASIRRYTAIDSNVWNHLCCHFFPQDKKRIKLMKLFDGNAANNKKEHAIKLHLTHFIGNRLLIEHRTMHGNYFMEFYRFILMHRFYCLWHRINPRETKREKKELRPKPFRV